MFFSIKTVISNDIKIFIINMNTPHVFHPDKNNAEPFVVYDLMFTPEFFDESLTGNKAIESLNNSYMFYSLFNEHEESPPYYNVTGENYTMFGELFNKIYMEHRSRKKGYIEIIRAYLLQMIITTFRMDRKIEGNSKNNKNDRVVKYITDYIYANYKSHISVEKLSKEVFLHPDYVGRIFRSATGMSISVMIQKVRVDKACHYLSSTDFNISDVAQKCGFEDVKFFHTVFKKMMGMSPGDYRKQTQNK